MRNEPNKSEVFQEFEDIITSKVDSLSKILKHSKSDIDIFLEGESIKLITAIKENLTEKSGEIVMGIEGMNERIKSKIEQSKENKD